MSTLLTKMRRRHKEYGIADKPFVVVKADQGTRGMGIATVRDVKGPRRAATAGAKRRQAGRGADIPRGEVIIQEGVLTNERVHDAAEPVVYHDRPLRGGRLLPHPCRARRRREPQRPGARFVPLPFAGNAHLLGRAARARRAAQPLLHTPGDRRLAMVAASYELEATDPELAGHGLRAGPHHPGGRQ